MNARDLPLAIYLDSSDFSVLSDPKRRDKEAPGVLEDLRSRIGRGEIECFFSGAHLTEMAPLEASVSDAALRRADLLVELCGTRALISHDRLFKKEARVALDIEQGPVDAFDRSGRWYPEGAADMSPVTEIDHALSVQKTIDQMCTSRADRRRAKRKILKGGMPRPEVRQALLANARSGPLQEILESFPMRPDSARVLTRYAIGDATAEEASAAYEESLKDPRLIMQWCQQHHNELTPFIAWARGPSNDLLEKVLLVAQLIANMRSDPLVDAATIDDLTGAKWQSAQDELLRGIANKLAEAVSPGRSLALADVWLATIILTG